jgi:hypothetical protein
VGEAINEEVAGEIDGAPLPGLLPHMERGLHDRARWVLLLRCGTRSTEGRSVVLHLLGRVVLGIWRGREPNGWCVGEEEEERPLIKELGAVRVANEMKRCACISGAWMRRRGEPMKCSGARTCVSVAVLKPFSLKRGGAACIPESRVHASETRCWRVQQVTAVHQRPSTSLPPPAHACSVAASRACMQRRCFPRVPEKAETAALHNGHDLVPLQGPTVQLERIMSIPAW